ncbi:hypothetical protein L4P92_004766, partial [Pseudomonas aeruginosa]
MASNQFFQGKILQATDIGIGHERARLDLSAIVDERTVQIASPMPSEVRRPAALEVFRLPSAALLACHFSARKSKTP